ncbi:MAG TPA: arsenite methyltransferase [Candidatus Limnocylindrales bacterium]|nr:arsenite methyltransferase [Candidatus Limnocylindrales bacterium]
MNDQALELNAIQEHVRDRYREAALAASSSITKEEAARKSEALSGCCGPVAIPLAGESIDGSRVDAAHAGGTCNDGCCTDISGTYGLELYDAAAREGLPDAAVLASLGCGNPVAVAELREGETVLDLGSGGGIDVLLSGKRVGPTGHAIGVDMTDEMLDLARRNAEDAGAANVEFRKGTIEALPVDDATVDVVISNCVINLASDKAAVFAEIARVLRPGGRMGVSDVVADDTLSPEQRAERGSYVGCIAGALSFREFRQGLEAVGMTDVELVPTHQLAEGMHSAIVRATKPSLA